MNSKPCIEQTEGNGKELIPYLMVFLAGGLTMAAAIICLDLLRFIIWG